MNNGNAVSIIFLYCSEEVKSNRRRKDTYSEMDMMKMSQRIKKINRLFTDGAYNIFFIFIRLESNIVVKVYYGCRFFYVSPSHLTHFSSFFIALNSPSSAVISDIPSSKAKAIYEASYTERLYVLQKCIT